MQAPTVRDGRSFVTTSLVIVLVFQRCQGSWRNVLGVIFTNNPEADYRRKPQADVGRSSEV